MSVLTRLEDDSIKFKNHGIHMFVQDLVNSEDLPKWAIEEVSILPCSNFQPFKILWTKDGLLRWRQRFTNAWLTSHLSKYPERIRSHIVSALSHPAALSQCSMQLFYVIFQQNMTAADCKKIVSVFSELHNFTSGLDAPDLKTFLSLTADFLKDRALSEDNVVTQEKHAEFAKDLTRCLLDG